MPGFSYMCGRKPRARTRPAIMDWLVVAFAIGVLGLVVWIDQSSQTYLTNAVSESLISGPVR